MVRLDCAKRSSLLSSLYVSSNALEDGGVWAGVDGGVVHAVFLWAVEGISLGPLVVPLCPSNVLWLSHLSKGMVGFPDEIKQGSILGSSVGYAPLACFLTHGY
jgi:hypothetical protein